TTRHFGAWLTEIKGNHNLSEPFGLATCEVLEQTRDDVAVPVANHRQRNQAIFVDQRSSGR
ncbi:MAG: hypothetical protein EBV49_11100, partial [Betaproteobacteria bacterium]|nr:hypothetical protein [Betaproteobacteria bacterium]